MYRDGDTFWKGSSLSMIYKIREGFDNIKQRKPWEELDFEFIFIDKKEAHTICLEKQLKDAGFEEFLRTGVCKIRKGSFEKELDYCIERIKERKGYSFFFLDPFGLNVLPATVRRILGIGRSEILFNYMLSGLVRLIKHRDTRYQKLFQRLEADNYYRDIPSSDEDFQRRQALLRDETLKLFRQEGQAQFAHTFALMSQQKSTLYYLVHLSSNPTALSVMKDVSWAQSNLQYQYHYGVYGVGYKSMDDLEENLIAFDIASENLNFCVLNLAEQIMEFVHEGGEDVDSSFGTIYCSTFQENPATKHIYTQAINVLQENNEIAILREGKATKSRQVQSKDILYATGFKQMIFDLGVGRSSQPKKLWKRRRRLENIVMPNLEQLNFLILSDD